MSGDRSVSQADGALGDLAVGALAGEQGDDLVVGLHDGFQQRDERRLLARLCP